MSNIKTILFANTGWYLYNFRRSLAQGLRDSGVDVILVSPPDRYARRLVDDGFRWHDLPLSRQGINPLAELGAVVACYRLYRQERPALVHHFTLKPVAYGSIAAWIAGIPAVVNSIAGQGYVFVSPDQRAHRLRGPVRWLLRFALSRPHSRAIFQNQPDRDDFLARGLVADASSRIIRGSGVDVGRFRPSPEPEGIPTVVMASRMLRDKGVYDLVTAARNLHEGGVACRVLLAGDADPGNPASIPVEQLRSWSQAGEVEWLGHVEDVPALYAQSHIVVLPTAYGEGLPRSLIEAAAAGRPIVATDVPGCREVVRQGYNGLLVPVRDPARLADALRQLITDRQQRLEMGRRGRELAVGEFSTDRVVGDTLNLYREMLGPKFSQPDDRGNRHQG